MSGKKPKTDAPPQAVRRAPAEEAAAQAAQQARDAQRLLESEESCRQLAKMICAHLQNGDATPLEIHVDCALTLKLLDQKSDGGFFRARAEFDQILAGAGLTQENVRIKRYVKTRHVRSAGKIIITRP